MSLGGGTRGGSLYPSDEEMGVLDDDRCLECESHIDYCECEEEDE